MGPKHFQNKARREWWSIHIEAWRRSGLSRRAYCRRHRLDGGTFARWLNALAGEETARKLTEYQTELRREKRREERKNGARKTRRQRFAISTDLRHRGLQAFWAMHVEAMNWSGMGVREYAVALSLSPYALRKWRDLLDEGEVEIDWRAHLHPSARPVVSTSAKESVSESSLTGAANDVPQAPATPSRRFFSDEQKLAIVKESVGAENTFSSDLAEFEAMMSELQPLIDKVWRHCEDNGTRGRTVTLKVKFADLELITRSRTVAGAVGSRSELEGVSAELLKALFPMKKAVRLLGVSISGFIGGNVISPQMPLF